MFGHDDQQTDNQNQSLSTPPNGFTPAVTEPNGASAPAASTTSTDDTAAVDQTTATAVAASSAPVVDDQPEPSVTLDTPTSATPIAEETPVAAAGNDLISIKQDAIQQLAPLVDHLDQSPEEKFRTTMMMIQATDDSSKLKDAYEIAKQIADDKIRAQALLDVVNEINYFTQQKESS